MTLAEIREAARAYGYELDTDAAMAQAIEAADRDIQGTRRWPWNEEPDHAVGTLADGNHSIEFQDPSLQAVRPIRDLDAVYLTKQSTDQTVPDLEYLAYAELRALLEDDNVGTANVGKGEPRYWTTHNNTIYFWPVADAAYTVTADVVFGSDQDVLASQGDSWIPRTPPDYHDLYVFYVVRTCAARERDWEMHGYMENQYRILKHQMVQAWGIRQRQNAQHVRDSGYYDGYRQ